MRVGAHSRHAWCGERVGRQGVLLISSARLPKVLCYPLNLLLFGAEAYVYLLCVLVNLVTMLSGEPCDIGANGT